MLTYQILSRLWIKSDPIVRSYGDHSIRSCPRKYVSHPSCQTIEEHLISTIINPKVEQIAKTDLEQNENEEISAIVL